MSLCVPHCVVSGRDVQVPTIKYWVRYPGVWAGHASLITRLLSTPQRRVSLYSVFPPGGPHRGQHRGHTGPTQGPHRGNTGPTQGQHRGHTGPTQGQHRGHTGAHTGATQGPHGPHGTSTSWATIECSSSSSGAASPLHGNCVHSLRTGTEQNTGTAVRHRKRTRTPRAGREHTRIHEGTPGKTKGTQTHEGRFWIM